MIHPRLRKDYDGEFVLVDVVVSGNKTQQHREWIPNAVENHHISGRAAVIVSGLDASLFKHQRLERHRGGLLGSKRLQTYGTGDVWQDMRFDFFVATQSKLVQQLVDANYAEKSTIYTTARHCLENPGKFYLVPHLPPANQTALAIYLAAFDGHQEIFILGCGIELDPGDKKWIDDVNQVFQAYKGAKFYLVTRQTVAGKWLDNPNVEIMPLRKFITYCDI